MNARSLSVAVLLLAACGGEESMVIIPDFVERTPAAECRLLAAGHEEVVGITALHALTDSTFMVVDGGGRQIALFDADTRLIRLRAVPEQGPGSVQNLYDAAASGDTLLVLADAGRGRVVAVSDAGEELWATDLGFPPQAMAFAGDRLLVAAVGMDRRIPALVHERVDGAMRPLSIPFVDNPDAIARMFVNGVTMQRAADGSVLVAHTLVTPVAWRIAAGGDVERFRVPVSEGEADKVGHVPPMPIRDEDIVELAAPMVSVAGEPATGHTFYLTRSGGTLGDVGEKAIVRVDSDFRYVGGIRLPVNAVNIVYLGARPDSLIVIDTDMRWHHCPVPEVTSPT